MGKQEKSEQYHFDMVNRIYSKMKDEQAVFFRLFRVYHPVYEISVNIETEQIEENYHIIEKYMDKLICGYIGGNKALAGGVFIKDKYELFKLLGIDKQAYEIADKFYNDLLEAGHFIEIPGVGIKGLKAAHASIKLEKRVSSATVKQKKLFDQFSGRLMSKEFYALKNYSYKRDTLDEKNVILKKSVWLEPNVTILNSNADIEHMLGNFDYVNQEQIERGLPQGFQRLSIAKDEPIEMAFYPYYLAIFKRESDYEYLAFRIDNGKQIKWVSDQYKTGYYSNPRELLETLSKISWNNTLVNPLYNDFRIKTDGCPDAKNGIVLDEMTGNYIWELQDWQIKILLGIESKENAKFSPSKCGCIASQNIICLTEKETGKLVHIQKSDAQKKILSAAANKRLSLEERRDLFREYLYGQDEWDSEFMEDEAKESVQPENDKKESVIEDTSKEYSMLHAFVEQLKKETRRNFEIRWDQNAVVWTEPIKKYQNARVVVRFRPEGNSVLQYAYVHLYNYVNFPAEKLETMYKVCNDANARSCGLDFYVDEMYGSITINMQSWFTKEICGQQCLEDIYMLLQAAENMYQMFMNAL